MAESERSLTSRPEKGRKKRTLEDRVRAQQGKVALKKGEHLEDLVLYRNATFTAQKLQNDLGEWVTLNPKAFTEKSFNQHIHNPDMKPVPFEGGTVILSRKRGMSLVTIGLIEEIEVVERADPEDYE